MGNGGNFESSLANSSLTQNWEQVDQSIYKNKLTKQLIRLRQVQISDKNLDSELRFYSKRMQDHHLNVLRLIYFKMDNDHCQGCVNQHTVKVFIQKVQKSQYNGPKVCCCQEIMKGFVHLAEHYGFSRVNQRMVWKIQPHLLKDTQSINNHTIKVWFNQEPASNESQKCTEKQMISDLANLLTRSEFRCPIASTSISQVFLEHEGAIRLFSKQVMDRHVAKVSALLQPKFVQQNRLKTSIVNITRNQSNVTFRTAGSLVQKKNLRSSLDGKITSHTPYQRSTGLAESSRVSHITIRQPLQEQVNNIIRGHSKPQVIINEKINVNNQFAVKTPFLQRARPAVIGTSVMIPNGNRSVYNERTGGRLESYAVINLTRQNNKNNIESRPSSNWDRMSSVYSKGDKMPKEVSLPKNENQPNILAKKYLLAEENLSRQKFEIRKGQPKSHIQVVIKSQPHRIQLNLSKKPREIVNNRCLFEINNGHRDQISHSFRAEEIKSLIRPQQTQIDPNHPLTSNREKNLSTKQKTLQQSFDYPLYQTIKQTNERGLTGKQQHNISREMETLKTNKNAEFYLSDQRIQQAPIQSLKETEKRNTFQNGIQQVFRHHQQDCKSFGIDYFHSSIQKAIENQQNINQIQWAIRVRQKFNPNEKEEPEMSEKIVQRYYLPLANSEQSPLRNSDQPQPIRSSITTQKTFDRYKSQGKKYGKRIMCKLSQYEEKDSFESQSYIQRDPLQKSQVNLRSQGFKQLDYECYQPLRESQDERRKKELKDSFLDCNGYDNIYAVSRDGDYDVKEKVQYKKARFANLKAEAKKLLFS